ncbi:MAG: chalcone isomerase family protein [Rhodoferax sp.]|nr:chalcone isomerase family protein [Rhodoferax sp.]
MPKRRTLLSACAVSLLTGTSLTLPRLAHAQATPPAEVSTELPGALWAGSARMRFFGLDIYDTTLWVTPGFRAGSYAQHELALTLTYLRGLSGRAIAQRSLKEMGRVGDISPESAQRWLAAMLAAFPDVKEGDRITGLHSPAAGARFWHNSQPRAAIRDPEFSRLFFGIWLSESTSEPQLRSALLAQTRP